MREQITRSIIVKSSPEEAFRVWSNFDNFPKFMKHVKSVTRTEKGTSYWAVDGPAGTTIEWEAEITKLDENKRLGWSTKDRVDGDIKTSGQVTFNDLPDEQTEVTVMLQYVPQTTLPGRIVARFFSDPEKMLEEDLTNFKAFIEGMHERISRE